MKTVKVTNWNDQILNLNKDEFFARMMAAPLESLLIRYDCKIADVETCITCEFDSLPDSSSHPTNRLKCFTVPVDFYHQNDEHVASIQNAVVSLWNAGNYTLAEMLVTTTGQCSQYARDHDLSIADYCQMLADY